MRSNFLEVPFTLFHYIALAYLKYDKEEFLQQEFFFTVKTLSGREYCEPAVIGASCRITHRKYKTLTEMHME